MTKEYLSEFARRVTGRMVFNKLHIGDTFRFELDPDMRLSGIARGPWIKTSARGYTHAETGGKYKVGSINVATVLETLLAKNPSDKKIYGWLLEFYIGRKRGFPARLQFPTKEAAYAFVEKRNLHNKIVSLSPITEIVNETIAPRTNPRRKIPSAYYKGFIIQKDDGAFYVFDVTGQRVGAFRGIPEAKKAVDAYINKVWRKRGMEYPVKGLRNPLTRGETRAVKAEARIHAGIRGKGRYYKGVAEGMRDIAAQYGKNPPETKIYERVVEVVAVKGPGHKCDAACKRARHTYVHKFTRKSGVYGSADGSRIIIH